MVYTVKYNQSSVPEVGDTLLVDTVDSDNESGEMSWHRIPTEFSIADDQGDSDVVNLPERLTFIGGNGLTSNVGDNTVTFSLDSSGASAGTFGSDSAIPILTVNERGQITGVSTASIPQPTTYLSIVYGQGSHSFVPPAGCYVSSSGATVSGAGIASQTITSGQIVGPTNGIDTLNLSVDSGEFSVLSEPT